MKKQRIVAMILSAGIKPDSANAETPQKSVKESFLRAVRKRSIYEQFYQIIKYHEKMLFFYIDYHVYV